MGTTEVLKSSTEELAELNTFLLKSTGQVINPNTFCVLPFIQYSTSTSGDIHLCCRSHPVGSIAKNSLSEFWESEKMQTIRQELTTGKRRSECQSCWELEDLSMVSLRHGQNIQRAFANKERIATWLRKRSLNAPHTLELKLSNLCNLKCRMCSPADSTAWISDWKSIRDLYNQADAENIHQSLDYQSRHKAPALNHFSSNDRFMADLSVFAPDLQELEFAGGEPLLDPTHYEVLGKVLHRASEIGLKYSTNLMSLGTRQFDVRDFWPTFKKVKVTISIDGPAGLNEYIRTGVKTKTLEKNIQILKSMPNVSLMGSTCLSTYNALYLRETCEYVASLGISWHANRVRSPGFLDARILPADLKSIAVKKLLEFKSVQFRDLDLPEVLRHRSLRTLTDCISWLEDPSKENRSYFGKFLEYKLRLDQVRKTSFPPLDKQLQAFLPANPNTEKIQAIPPEQTLSEFDQESS